MLKRIELKGGSSRRVYSYGEIVFKVQSTIEIKEAIRLLRKGIKVRGPKFIAQWCYEPGRGSVIISSTPGVRANIHEALFSLLLDDIVAPTLFSTGVVNVQRRAVSLDDFSTSSTYKHKLMRFVANTFARQLGAEFVTGAGHFFHRPDNFGLIDGSLCIIDHGKLSINLALLKNRAAAKAALEEIEAYIAKPNQSP